MAIIFGYLNLKGGVGKSTLSIALADGLARRGFKVLLVDVDPDKCATDALIPKSVMSPQDKSILDVLLDPAHGITEAVHKYMGTSDCPITYSGTFDLLRGSTEVAFAPQQYSGKGQPVGRFEEVPLWLARNCYQNYDVVIIDPSPSDDALTKAFYLSIHQAIVPTSAEPMAQRGVLNLFAVLQKLNTARATFGGQNEIHLLGLALCKIFPTQQANAEKFAAVLDAQKIARFTTIIPYSDAAALAPGACLPLSAYAPNDPIADCYTQLVNEIVIKANLHV